MQPTRGVSFKERFSFLGMAYTNVLSPKGEAEGATLPISFLRVTCLFLSGFETKPPSPYTDVQERKETEHGGEGREILARVPASLCLANLPRQRTKEQGGKKQIERG